MKAPSARILQRAFLYKRKPRDYRVVFFYTKNPETLRFRDFGGAGVIKDEHPSVSLFSPSKASSISSSGILSMLMGFLLALIIKVK